MEPHFEIETNGTVRDSANLPHSVSLELTVYDPDTIAELSLYVDRDAREQFVLKALRIGILALRQARGQIDAELVRRESERLLETLQSRLNEHSNLVHERLTSILKDYFDPKDGRFPERVDRLVKQDGELETVLRRQIGNEDSQLCKTLTAHFGQESPLMQLLSPDQSQGLMAALQQTLDSQLATQREHVLKQFSLDNKDGALSRFIRELTDRQGQLSEKLHRKIDEVVKEFSLDNEESALSRLVRNVDRAQRTITREFSLDEETSALSRLKKMLENTNNAIHNHLSLDDESSPLARLKRELLVLLNEHREINQKFQEEVKGTLQAMAARRQESKRSTRHGLEFEDALFALVQYESQRIGDIATRTGNTTGQIKNCKVGDCVIELGPDSVAAKATIVVEAKEKESYNLAKAREEIEIARRNRNAQVGLFVFSSRSAPEGIEPLTRYGQDVVVAWDSEDQSSDIYLRVGLTLARALCVRSQQERAGQRIDFSAIDQAILEIEKRVRTFDEIEKLTKTIRSNSEKILKKIAPTRKSLDRQVKVLRDETEDLKHQFVRENSKA